MEQLVTKSIAEAPNEIGKTKQTLLPATGKVEEAEASTDIEGLRNSLEAFDIDDLREILEYVKKRIDEAKSKEAENKLSSSSKKANKGKSKPSMKSRITSADDAEKELIADKGDKKLMTKCYVVTNDVEKILEKVGNIGSKPTLMSSCILLQQILKRMGNVHYAAIGLSMVASVMERWNLVSENSGKVLDLLDKMYNLGWDMVRVYEQLPDNSDLLESTVTEITKGVCFCCCYTGRSFFKRLVFAPVSKDELNTLSEAMKYLSERLGRACDVASLHGIKAISNHMKEGHMAVLDGQTSTRNQIKEDMESLPNKVATVVLERLSIQPILTTNTRYGLSKGMCTESSNVMIPERTSLYKSEEATVEKENFVQAARPENLQHLPKDMTDVHVEVEKIVNKLKNSATVGLVGMGGLGKTTLAKAVFNDLSHNFDYTCFVSEVKLVIGREDDVKDELWRRLHFQGRKVGGERNLSVLRGKRLLLALDDVSNRDIQILRELADDVDPASRFIWTSREHDILKDAGTIHEVSLLAYDHARLLFMKHAFPETTIPALELRRLVRIIVKKCEGLPLALEVLGKYLRGKEDREFWEATLSLLNEAGKVKNIDERLWTKLRLSFKGLEETELQIFLDAVNFFCESRHLTLGQAKMAWKAIYGEVIELSWQTLVDMSLVYGVGEQERIRVHEQLRCIGRVIASESQHRGK